MRQVLCIFVLGLVACGGSQAEPLHEQYGLSGQAEAWENHMPSVILPGQPLPGQPTLCTPLIVSFTVTATKALPSDFTADSVSLGKNGSEQWKEAASSSGTPLTSTTTIEGVARGCRTPVFAAGETLDAIIHVKTRDAEADVRTSATLKYAW
jgi:hypothetical protein